MDNSVLIVGSSRAEVQAALDLADCGIMVHLVESKPFLGGQEEYLNPDLFQNTRLLELLKHPHITTWTNTILEGLSQNNGSTQAVIYQSPRYVDLTRCTACGDCLEVCPVTIPETGQKAILLGGQPGCAVIQKTGISPCTNACPAGIHVQGYVALIAQGRYNEAYQLILDALPFPSVCGRVCNHYCEASCSRIKIDEPVNIMALKRFVSDWALSEGREDFHQQDQEDLPGKNTSGGKKVAIIGAGPAGLTAARDLVRAGYRAKVFDANPKPGGMMRVGIPPHRLPYDHLEWEIEQIITEGVELQLNSWVEDIPGLLKEGYEAVLIATGAHKAVKVSLENSDHPDNWLSLEFLKKVCLGEKINLEGRKVIVLGGGDVAMDAARSAVRLGKPEVKIVCRGLRASFNEIREAEEEGIQVIRNRVFKKIVLDNGNITGVECIKAEVGDIVDGKRQFTELPGTEHLVPGDLVIWAVGQKPDFSFLPNDDQIIYHSSTGIQADPQMMTSLKGVFSAGDVRRGTTFFVVDAVGEGHRAAQSIMDYLEGNQTRAASGEQLEVDLSRDEVQKRLDLRKEARVKRTPVQCIQVSERENNFKEVELTIGEKEARREAGRCLSCGPCSECMACIAACEPGAIIFNQAGKAHYLDVGSILINEESELPRSQSDVIQIQAGDEYSGSAAAYQAMKELGVNGAYQRSHLLRTEDLSSAVDERIGLVLCQCGGEISRYIDLEEISNKALDWEGVVFAGEIPLACSKDGAETIRGLIKDQRLDQLVLGACSCCSLDQICYSCTYQRMRCKENLGIFDKLKYQIDLEFVNIREQCAWVHSQDKKIATAVAERLIKSTLSRLSDGRIVHLIPDQKPRRVAVIGSSPAAENIIDLMDRSGIQSDRITVIPKQMLRTGGGYLLKNGEDEVRVDLILLAPRDKRELNRLGKAHQMLNDRTIIGTITDQRELLNYGIIICPPGLEPEAASEGAFAQIISWLNRINQSDVNNSAVVDPLRCRVCGTCQEVCGFGIPDIVEDSFGRHAAIDPQLCQGCGICAAQCPSGAIAPGSTPEYVLEGIFDAILG